MNSLAPHIPQNKISRIEGLGLMGQMESLNLAFNEIETMEGLTAFGRLRELNLASNQLTVIESLKHCGSLQVFFSTPDRTQAD